MTGITPEYGIRFPTGATKQINLGAELETMAADIERALIAAEVAPVTPAAEMVAATAAARDAYWGTPATATARRTLQNLGATTIRTDTGITERYYAEYDATTNPGGVRVAGWYPVAGRTPAISLMGGNAQALNVGWTRVNSAFTAPRIQRGIGLSSGVLQIQTAGLYRVYAAFAGLGIDVAGRKGVQVTVNEATTDGPGALFDSQNSVNAAVGAGAGSIDVPLAVGDQIRMFVVVTNTAPPAPLDARAFTFGATYLSPE